MKTKMAIAMAQQGGIGIIHRFLTIEQQVRKILKVKRFQSIKIESPYTLNQDQTLGDVFQTVEETGIKSYLVLDNMEKLAGIITRRDTLFETDLNKKIRELMTPRNRMIVAPFSISIDEAKKILKDNKLETLPLVDDENKVTGLITSRDIVKKMMFPDTAKDNKGRLLVGAAIGVKEDRIERAIALARAGADVLVIDIAHGHSAMVLDTIREIRQHLGDIQLIAGNVATAEGAKALIDAGVDGIKVGVGPGSICTTRIVAGAGVPQMSAIMESFEVAKERNIPLIADGGIKNSGDIVKALAAGGSTVMIGNLLAGTDESPGSIITKEGRRYKVYRGMAGFGAASGRKQMEGKEWESELNDIVPEGIESIIPYRGSVSEVLHKLLGGLRSGMSYCGSRTIKELQQNAEFIRITDGGRRESTSHDVIKL